MTGESGATVLLAEDDFLVAEATTRALRGEGYSRVIFACTGAEAVAMTREHRPDVVVMDIQMPELDGLAAAVAIQETCPTPIVILTAHDSAELVAQATEAGVGAFLTKPADPVGLARAIEISRARHLDLMRMRSLVQELGDKAAKLERAMADIETLHGILPMCMFCKRIREDSGQWLTFEVYLRRRTDAQVSHGLCPACEAQHYEP